MVHVDGLWIEFKGFFPIPFRVPAKIFTGKHSSSRRYELSGEIFFCLRGFFMRIRLPGISPAGIFILSAFSVQATTLNVVFYNNQFGTLNDATGAYNQVGTLPISASAGIAYMDGTMYLENMGSDLYTVDPGTGASSLVGETGLVSTSVGFAGDSFGLFEVDYASNLYSLNPVTGQAELVGATGLAANNGGFDTSLSASGPSLYYTAGGPGAYDELYLLNTVTGLATDLGSTGVTGIAGSAVVGSELELFQYGQGVNFIYSAPLGSTDFVRDTQLAAQIIDGGAVISLSSNQTADSGVVPEPGSGLLLMAGLISIVLMRRAAASARFSNRLVIDRPLRVSGR
jgi:PEP-CTERM motif